MKSLLSIKSLWASIFVLCFSFNSKAVTSPINPATGQKVILKKLYGISFDQAIPLTLEDVMFKDRKEIEHKLNSKLSLKQKIALKYSKFKIKKMQKKGLEIESAFPAASSNFHFLSFILGFFFSLIGILISWLLWGKRGLRSSLYGALFGLILVLLGVLV